MRNVLLEELFVLQQDLDALLVLAHHPSHHVLLEHLADACTTQGARGELVLVAVDRLEHCAFRVEDELLQGGNHPHRVLQVKALDLGVLRLEHRLHKRRHTLAEDVLPTPGRVVHRAGGLEAADPYGGLLGEVSVSDVAEGPPFDAAITVLGQCLPNGDEILLDGKQSLLWHLPTTTHGFTHGSLNLTVEARGIHLRVICFEETLGSCRRWAGNKRKEGREDHGIRHHRYLVRNLRYTEGVLVGAGAGAVSEGSVT
mmetsp:Transcript_72509/g.212523  ORF Transcript_72509/g.212523 Transcript_72509/m.212523 type:complete len:256 (+) Transcript_72509:1160-1927(+)